MDGSSSISAAGSAHLPPQVPPAAGGGSPKSDAASFGGIIPLDLGQKRFNIEAPSGGGGKADPSPAMQWVNMMLLTWIRESNQQSQQWVQSMADDEDLS